MFYKGKYIEEDIYFNRIKALSIRNDKNNDPFYTVDELKEIVKQVELTEAQLRDEKKDFRCLKAYFFNQDEDVEVSIVWQEKETPENRDWRIRLNKEAIDREIKKAEEAIKDREEVEKAKQILMAHGYKRILR